MDNITLKNLTRDQLRELLLQGENPFGELSRERYVELGALGIHDPLGYLTEDEWTERALKYVDPTLAETIIHDIYTINWSDLSHSFGTAEKLPTQIHAMLTNDYLAALVAWSNAPNYLLHQGSVGSATVASLRYFIRMVDSRDPYLQFVSLSYLSALAWYTRPQSPDNTLTIQSVKDAQFVGDENGKDELYSSMIWNELYTIVPMVKQLITSTDFEIQKVARIFVKNIEEPEDDE